MAQYTRFEKQYVVDVVVPQVTRIAGIAGNRNHAAWAGLAATMHQYLAARGLAKRLYTGPALYQYYHRKHSDTAHTRGDNDTQTVPTPPGARPIYDIPLIQAGHAIPTAGPPNQGALTIGLGNLGAANVGQGGNGVQGANRGRGTIRGRGNNNRSRGANLGQGSVNSRGGRGGILGVSRGGGHLHVGNHGMENSGRNAPRKAFDVSSVMQSSDL